MAEVGGPKLGLMNIGEEARPPDVILPNRDSIFKARSKRFAAVADGHELASYLRFLGLISGAQDLALKDLPQAAAVAVSPGTPPLARFKSDCGPDAAMAIRTMLEHLDTRDLPKPAADAVASLRAAPPAQLAILAANVLAADGQTQGDVAVAVLVAAGLQVYFSGLAAVLDADTLRNVADGACPTCGSAPLASAVISLPRANNTRFCTCWLCGTMWNVVRVKCVLCSATGGISYRVIEGEPDAVKAECCEACHAYVKILYQTQDPALEVAADDVATLGLDLMMAKDGWRRGSTNPFMAGY